MPASPCSARACCCAVSMTTRRRSANCCAPWSNAGSSPTTCITPISRRAPRIGAPASRRVRNCCARCMAGFPACASRATCWISPAATARRRSVRAISPMSAAATARRATRSKTSTDAAMPIRRRAELVWVPLNDANFESGTLGASPAAPHLAPVAPCVVVEDRADAAAVPVAGDEPDPFARDPAEAGRRPSRKARAIDDETRAVGGRYDLDHVSLGRQSEPVLVVVLAYDTHLVRQNRLAHQQAQRERHSGPVHLLPPH